MVSVVVCVCGHVHFKPNKCAPFEIPLNKMHLCFPTEFLSGAIWS